MTDNALIIITKDHNVYEAPGKTLKEQIDNLYLRTKPIPLKDKYPNLYNDKHFQDIQSAISVVFIMKDKYSYYLLFNAWGYKFREGGIIYNLKTGKTRLGFYTTGDRENDQVIISTQIIVRYYALSKYDNTLLLTTYKLNNDDLKYATRLAPDPTKDELLLCLDGANIYTIKVNDGHCIQNVDWPLLNGFVSSDNEFILFGEYNVYIFSLNVITPNSKIPLKTLYYNQFFSCPGILPTESS